MESSDGVPQLLRFKDLQRVGVAGSWAGLRNLQGIKAFHSASCSDLQRGSGLPLKSMSGWQHADRTLGANKGTRR